MRVKFPSSLAATTNFKQWQTNIYVTDISTQGFSSRFTQLFFNNTRQTLSRYPNHVGFNTNSYNFVAAGGGGSATQFGYTPGDLHSYSNAAELKVMNFPNSYSVRYLPVTEIDAVNHLVKVGAGGVMFTEHSRYYFENALEDLDGAGEWYLDGTTKYLYFWPPSSLTWGHGVGPVVVQPVHDGCRFKQHHDRGFTMTCCEGAAVVLTGTTNCRVTKNRLLETGLRRLLVRGFGHHC